MAKDILKLFGIIRDIDALSESEQKELAKVLLGVLSGPKKPVRRLGEEDISKYPTAKPTCPYCGNSHVVKKGFADDGITRRYKCLDCIRSFRRTTNTVLSNTRKKTDAWETFILLTLKGASLETCSQRCGICMSTAFVWRHKILTALAQTQVSDKLSGVVEMDETFFGISYKGNHTKSKNFTMPRPAYKRGTTRPMMNDRACVLCAVERGKKAYSEVVCRGSLSTKLLGTVLPKHLSNESIVLTDGLYAYASYFRTAPQAHKGIKAKAKGKGAYHINNINNYHGRLRNFLRNYNGVSTKYLNNYVALFAWLENIRLSALQKETAAIGVALKYGSYKPKKEFATWTRLPAVA